MYDVTLFVRAEDESLAQDGAMSEGEIATKLGLVGISPLSEIIHVSRFIELARYYDIKIVFKAIAQPRSLDLIEQAKREGVRVQAEVSLHHLLFSDSACDDFNTTAKIDPPLVSEEKRVRLLQALQEGKIDMLTTLHHPQSAVNKEVAFAQAKYGTDNIGEALTLYYDKLIKNGIVSMSRLIELTCKHPARSIARECGEIKEGMRCDFVVFDPKKELTIDNANSLYCGETLQGRVVRAFIDERIVEV